MPQDLCTSKQKFLNDWITEIFLLKATAGPERRGISHKCLTKRHSSVRVGPNPGTGVLIRGKLDKETQRENTM